MDISRREEFFQLMGRFVLGWGEQQGREGRKESQIVVMGAGMGCVLHGGATNLSAQQNPLRFEPCGLQSS